LLVDGRGSRSRTGTAAARPLGPWAFIAVALASFGGPLALAALNAPALVADASSSAGLAMVAAVVVFAAPMAIWLRFSRHVTGSGGLFAFVEAAAGRRIALVQAALWIVAYALYLVYTTVQIVYDLLPQVVPGVGRYQTLLALLIPAAIAGVMITGRAAALVVLGVIGVGQLALAGILDGVTLAHVATPTSTFGTGAPAGSLAKASAQTSLLYICGSLPLFLGGELVRPTRTIRHGLTGAYLLTAVVVTLAVAPLAAMPWVLRTSIPGVTVAQEFAGPGLARAIGIGVAVSIAGLILFEYVALTRLLHAIGGWGIRPLSVIVAAVMIIAAPLTLIDPQGFYGALVKPSLITLWLSQLIVFAVYPRYAAAQRQRAIPAWTLAFVAGGLAIYGLWTGIQTAAS